MSRNLLRAASLGLAIAAGGMLTACDDLGSALGMERSNVDEGGTVPTEPTLAIPPDFDLKPPRETPKSEDAESTDHPAPTDPAIHSGQ